MRRCFWPVALGCTVEVLFSERGSELADSRGYVSDDPALNSSAVNTLELLQAYVALTGTDVIAPGDYTDLTFGRLTLDLGSRRLVARNSYRNTINGFTGIDAQWLTPGRHSLRAFAAMPVIRRPTGGRRRYCAASSHARHPVATILHRRCSTPSSNL